MISSLSARPKNHLHTIGRYGILALPNDWVLQHIEALAEPLLQLEDAWENRRLLEV